MEGSISKIVSYESGLIVLATWGMQFLCHVDDCSRAVFAAINIKKHLTKLQLDVTNHDDSFVEPPVHIGIATGDVF
jgi:class 3 adenylate cyclase